jgi:hypothetical protein
VPANILIVGAGAVGQVFAWLLQQGGAKVSFYVKPQHSLAPSLVLFPQAKRRVVLSGFERFTSAQEVAQRSWDQIWVTVPADALLGEWFPQLLKATGDASWVTMAPESEGQVPAARLVIGAIPYMAWQSPLPGDASEPGVAYWIPPLARVPLSGENLRVEAILALLRGGELPGQRVKDAAKSGRPMTAVLIPLVAALEAEGWSLRGFRGPWARLAAQSAQEALAIVRATGPARWLAHGWVLQAVLKIVAWIVPFDLERYLRYHFTKVGAQTRLLLSRWQGEARAQGLPSPRIDELARHLGA